MSTLKRCAPIREARSSAPGQRRGPTATYVALVLPVIGGFGAVGVEFVYLGNVQLQLDGVSAAAAHAAMVELNYADGGLAQARAVAVAVVEGTIVDRTSYSLDPDAVIFGFYDPRVGSFVESEDPAVVNSVRVPLAKYDVGLGFGGAFFGRWHSVFSCAAVAIGEGNANTGQLGGPGLANGHFDYETVDARRDCAGASTCAGVTKHTHQFDNTFGTTFADQLSDLGSHLPITGCTDDAGSIGNCDGVTYTRAIADDQEFKIVVLNADLSPGAWISINGVDYDVEFYDDLPMAALPTYQLQAGTKQLWELTMNFEVQAIANCELLPTNTSDVKPNTPGIYGEWRSGALTVQLVSPTATTTPGRSGGDHDAVISQDDGLLYEAAFFWHWSGPSYTQADAYDWQTQHDQLDCRRIQFVEHTSGGAACQ